MRAFMRAGLLLAAVACGRCATPDDPSTVRVIDLLDELPRAEKRPADGAFEIAEHRFAGIPSAGIEVPPASRVIWTLRLPARAVLRTTVAVLPAANGDVTVNFRIGISDDRLYEQLAQERVSASRTRDAGWTPISADLSPYAGWKWSVFYRPDSISWRVVLSTDRLAGNGRAFWAAPRVESDVDAAREWRRRH